MNIRFDEDLFAKNAQSVSKIYYEVLMLVKLLQTKPQVKNVNIDFYDLYNTVNKNRDDREITIDEYEMIISILMILFLIKIWEEKITMKY